MEVSKIMATKPTATVHDQRIDKIYELMIAGLSRKQILQYAATKTDWDASVRTIDSYVAIARERMIDLGRINHAEELGRAIGRLHSLYLASLKIQDYKAALSVCKELISLLGLAQPAKLSVQGPDGQALKIDATSIASEIMRLKDLKPQEA